MEGVLAGKNVKQSLASLRHPTYSPPLWAWYVIGGLYYVICCVVLYRMFRHTGESSVRNIAVVLLLSLMSVNVIWNYVFFRARNLFVSVFAFSPYLIFAVALFICLLQFDVTSALFILLYLLYLVYASTWAYRLWTLNRS